VSFKGDFYPESRLSGFSHVDGTVAFYSQVNALLTPQSVVLDVGCGRGAYAEDKLRFRRELRILKGKCRKVIGIDLDPAGEANPFVDEFRRIEGAHWPVESGTVDVCVSDNVLEHVADPDRFFSECQRVLKSGGVVCIRTPNVLSYFGLVSKLIPNRKHVSVLEIAKERVQEQDTFPTLYRCNTIPCIRRMLVKHGFEAIVYGYEAEPGYFSFSRLLYFLGVLHQRLAPNLFKVGIHAFGRKL